MLFCMKKRHFYTHFIKTLAASPLIRNDKRIYSTANSLARSVSLKLLNGERRKFYSKAFLFFGFLFLLKKIIKKKEKKKLNTAEYILSF